MIKKEFQGFLNEVTIQKHERQLNELERISTILVDGKDRVAIRVVDCVSCSAFSWIYRDISSPYTMYSLVFHMMESERG